MVKVVQNNQNLQILFTPQSPIRFSLKKYPSEMKFAPKKAPLFLLFGAENYPSTGRIVRCPSRKACFSNELETISVFVVRFLFSTKVSSVLTFLLLIAEFWINHPPT
jgi:hypothetical protein